MNPTKIVFDTDKFMNQLQTYSQALNESLKKNLKSQMEKEINSKISSKKANIDTQTLNAFKKKVSSTYTGTMPDAIYKVLIQNMSDEILASDYFKLEDDLDDDPEKLVNFLAKVSNYIYEILDKKKTTVTVDKKKYQVEFPFGTTVTMATVTDLSNNKSYSLTWKDTGATLKTLTSFMSDLIAYEKSSSYKIVKNYLLDVINIAVDDYLDYLADNAIVTKNISEYLKNKLSDYKEELESIGYTIDSIKDFFKAFFPQTDSGLTQIQKNYKTFAKYETELEKAVSKLKNPDADTIKNLTAYKNFLSAYETLSGKTLNISPEDYVTYYFKEVHNAEITQIRASIVGTSQVDSIISEGKNSTIYGESGNDALLIEGDYSKVYGGADKDSIIIAGNNSEVQGDAGDDNIIITGANVKAEGGYGQDTILVRGSNITVTGDGETFDYIPIGDTFIIDSSARNILITDFEKSADKLQLNFSDIVVDLSFVEGEQSLVILSADKYEKIVLLQGVSESSFNNINYNGNVTSIDWLLENKKFTVKNPYENIIQVKNNKLENTLSGVQIQAASGNNKITNKGSEVTISAGTGNDYIDNYGGNVTINASDGNDSIYNNWGSKVTTNGGDGNDFIYNYGNNVTISGDGGNDSIYSYGYYAKINGGVDDDYIYNSLYYHSATINGGDGNDSIYNEGAKDSINGGAGDDTIYNSNYSSSVTINGGAGDDYVPLNISSNCNVIQYANGDGNDTICGFNSDDTIKISGAKYSTLKSGNDLKIIVGSGSILLKDVVASGIKLNLQGTLGADTVSTLETAKNISNTKSNTIISGTKYADTISNLASRVTIDGAADNDSITSIGDRVSISGGAGNDIIYSDVAGSIESGANVTINSGAGNDYISNDSAYSKLGGNDGKDTITNYGWNTTIDGGTGNDIINNFKAFGDEGNNVTISGGAGNDTINSYGKSVTISGGAGNDKITSNGTLNSYLYSSGDGNDTIIGFTANDTIYINSGKLSSASVSGSNIFLTIGNGSILLTDAKDKNITVKDVAGTHTFKNTYSDSATVPTNNFTSGNDFYSNNTANTTLNALGGNDSIYNHANKVLIKGGAGNDDLTSFSDSTNVTLKGEAGNDTIYSWSSKSYIDGGEGSDYLYSGNSNHTVLGGAGNDSVISYGSYSSIFGGAGNDFVSLTAISYYTKINYESGDGKDTIYGLDSDDTLQITGAKYTTAKSGSDLIIGVGNDSISVVGGANVAFKINGTLKSNIADGISVKNSIVTASKNFKGNKINLSDYAATKVNASAVTQAVNIVGTAAANSLKGGKGADTISGGAGNDTVSLGGGKDVYIYSGGNDVIQDYTAGQDKIKFASGLITSASVSNSNVILKTSNGNITIKNGKNKKITVIDSSGKETSNIYSLSTIPAGISVKNSLVTVAKTFTGNKIDLANYAATKVNASAVTQAVSIVGTAAANSLKGGKGADTISGGAGNDTVSLGGGKDVYIYSGGNDVIQDYTAGQDKIKLLSGTISGASVSGNDVVLKVGSGSITVKNGKGKYITTIDSKGNAAVNIYDQSNGVQGKEIDNRYGSNVTLLSGGLGNDTIWNSEIFVSINGGAGDDWINNGAENVTINGEKGDDAICNNSQENTKIFYNSGDGNDTIYGINESDTIDIAGAKYSSMRSGSDLKINVGIGSILIKGGMIVIPNVKGILDEDNTSPYVKINNSGSNTIVAGTSFADEIWNSGSNVKIISSDGDDLIFFFNSFTTIKAGRGNDEIRDNSPGYNTYIYNSGDGNDTILGIHSSDTLQITGDTYDTMKSGSDVIFKVGNGSITVENGVNIGFNINFKSSSGSNSRTLDLLYDNNFITDELQIDDISEVTETNYSVGQIENSNNSNEFVMDSIVAATSFDKK